MGSAWGMRKRRHERLVGITEASETFPHLGFRRACFPFLLLPLARVYVG